MKKIISLFSVSLVLLAMACSEKKQVKEETKKFVLSDTMQKMITLDTAGTAFVDDSITLTGEVSFNENNVSKVYPRNSGQVVDCKVTLGDYVKAGQTLAVLRSADVAGNYADLSSANADIAIAKRQMDNTESLYKNGIASERELTEARQNYEKAKAAKSKIESVININGGNGSNAGGTYTLNSPISGYIVEKKVNAGNFIRGDMGDNLFTISDLKTVWVYANVFEADIPKVKEGYNADVVTIAYPDKRIHGTVDKMSQVLDPTNKTLRIRIKLENPDLMLRPEMFAKVILSNKENRKALSVPTSALINQNGKSYVVVYKSPADMHIAEVSILNTKSDRTYLLGGVQAGDKIITRNQLLVFQQLLNQ